MPVEATNMANEKLLDARILTYKELVSTPVKDDAEPLVTISSDPDAGIELGDIEYRLARQGAWERLKDAAFEVRKHDKRYGLKVWYAYRSLSVQTKFFEEQRALLKEKHPDFSEEQIREQVHLFVAVPDVAGHPAGGAFDLTVTLDGKPVDMGCEYPDFDSPNLHTFASGLTEAQKKNRMLLREAMMTAGFAPFNGEWWHFSYGDREWAAFYGKPTAIYSQVEASRKPDREGLKSPKDL